MRNNFLVSAWRKFFRLPLRSLLVLLVLPKPTIGWGKDGHELVGNLAYRLISEKTKSVVDQILVNHPALIDNDNDDNNKKERETTISTTSSTTTTTTRTTTTSTTTNPNNNNYTNTPLGEVADWADRVRIRKGYHWSGKLHYIDVHDDKVVGGCPVYGQIDEQRKECHFQYDRDCLYDACVAGAIVNYTNHLQQVAAANHWYHDHQQHKVQQQQENPSSLTTSTTTTTTSTPTDFFTFNNNNNSSNNNNRRLRGSSALLTPYKLPFFTAQTTTHIIATSLIQESLMFLTHFVGDIHQPLHCGRGSDRGGNSIPVTFKVPSHYHYHRHRHRHLVQEQQQSSSSSSHHYHQELHAVWDTSIIVRAIHTEYEHNRDQLEEELFNYITKDAKKSGEISKWLECPNTSDVTCTTKWAEESWRNAMEWAYSNTDGISEVVAGTDLTDDYYNSRWPKIRHYIAVAGVRLAAALEIVFDEGGEKYGVSYS